MTQKLGRLERVDLRKVWETEDRGFTPWLAKEENLELLGETIGMGLELEAQEKNVGPFRADILCKNMYDDSWVLIENQIERTDHTHLGQIFTYAAGLDAVTMVWIASRFTDEHRAALDWLNKITDEEFRFFGLEVEAWKIGDSLPAPKFNIISQPNDWSKSVSHGARKISEGAANDTLDMYYRYWHQLIKYMQDRGSILNPHSPRKEYGLRFIHVLAGIYIVATIGVGKKRNGVEILLENSSRESNKAFFNLLEQDKEAIETELDLNLDLEWLETPDQIRSRIAVYKDADPTDENDWADQHAWFKETIEKFDNVFTNRIRKLDPSDWKPDVSK